MAFEVNAYPFNIEIFSNFVCYVLPKKINLPPGHNFKSFPICVEVESLRELMERFHKMYAYEYSLIMQNIKKDKMHSFPLFMKTVVGRCLKLSEAPATYKRFLMACSLIHRICAEYLETTDCFLAANLCNACFISLYNRCYRDYFERREGTSDTLDFNMKALLAFLKAQEVMTAGRELDFVGMPDIQRIVRSTVYIDEASIQLTEYEVEMMTLHTENVPRDHLPVLRTLFEVKNNITASDSYTNEDSPSIPAENSPSIPSEYSPPMLQDSPPMPEASPPMPEASPPMPEASPPMTEASSTSTSSGELVIFVSRRPNKSSAAESTDTDFQKASTSAAADEADSKIESEERMDALRSYYKTINLKRIKELFDEPEFSDETSTSPSSSSSSSSSSNMECVLDRTQDVSYFRSLVCKFCKSRCSSYAVQFIDRYCAE